MFLNVNVQKQQVCQTSHHFSTFWCCQMQPCTQEEEQNSSPVLLDFCLLLELKKKKSLVYENSDAFVLAFKSLDLWVTYLTEWHVFRGRAGWFVGGLGFIHHLAGWGWRLRPSTRALRKTWYKT